MRTGTLDPPATTSSALRRSVGQTVGLPPCGTMMVKLWRLLRVFVYLSLPSTRPSLLPSLQMLMHRSPFLVTLSPPCRLSSQSLAMVYCRSWNVSKHCLVWLSARLQAWTVPRLSFLSSFGMFLGRILLISLTLVMLQGP